VVNSKSWKINCPIKECSSQLSAILVPGVLDDIINKSAFTKHLNKHLDKKPLKEQRKITNFFGLGDNETVQENSNGAPTSTVSEYYIIDGGYLTAISEEK
jgi:hypothetical protein